MPALEPSSAIRGVSLVRFQAFADSRGYFYESFRKSWLPDVPGMVQGNCSFSRAGVLRGLHYHLKQADFWSVPSGKVQAALYDFRRSSPTYGASQVLEMGPAAPIGLYIPKGVAHGFLALEDSIMSYLVDQYYDGDDELGIRWDDPTLGIAWDLRGKTPVLSARDSQNPLVKAIPTERWPG
jgi:dTDP-4-dehydrorhamnose 3,5-epimerase